MITFILPGYSSRNKEWVLEIADKLKLDHEVRPVLWDHWDDPEKTLRPKNKAQDIIDILKKDRANIIAKSVGTLIAAYVVSAIPDQIGKIILCGIPSVSDIRLKIFHEAFSKISPENIEVFQNERDPLASFLDVKNFIKKVNPNIRIIEKPRSDHHYPYSEDFQKILTG